jgi:hypothetical protein
MFINKVSLALSLMGLFKFFLKGVVIGILISVIIGGVLFGIMMAFIYFKITQKSALLPVMTFKNPGFDEKRDTA